MAGWQAIYPCRLMPFPSGVLPTNRNMPWKIHLIPARLFFRPLRILSHQYEFESEKVFPFFIRDRESWQPDGSLASLLNDVCLSFLFLHLYFFVSVFIFLLLPAVLRQRKTSLKLPMEMCSFGGHSSADEMTILHEACCQSCVSLWIRWVSELIYMLLHKHVRTALKNISFKEDQTLCFAITMRSCAARLSEIMLH